MDDESRIVSPHSNNKNVIIFSLVIVVVLLAFLAGWLGSALRVNNTTGSNGASGYVIVGNGTKESTTTINQSIPVVGVITQTYVPVENMANQEVDVTAAGFSPSSITISKGQSIVWTIRDNNTHWIESNPSDVYPATGPCGSSFDSCENLYLGDSFRMVFNDVGVWSYFDKLNPQFIGTVTVQ